MKILVFDLDETLGFFSQFSIFWEMLKIQNPLLTHEDFIILLDLYPEYLRPNIISILNFIKLKKNDNCCNKIYVYTNNQGPIGWINNIILYLEHKTSSKLFDKIIYAYKIGNIITEPLRTSHEKTYEDFIRCSNCLRSYKICFIDDTYYQKMIRDNVYYINVKPYMYMLSAEEIIMRFIKTPLSQNINNNIILCKLQTYSYTEKSPDEYIIDNILSKKIMMHLQKFLHKPKRRLI